MKRIIFITFVIFGFILSGCGTNSNIDPSSNNIGVGGYDTKTGFINYTKELNITNYSKYTIEFQYADKDGFVVADKKVCVKAFDKHYGSVASRYGGSQPIPSQTSSQCVLTDADGIGKFIYTPPVVMPQVGTTYNLSLITDGENNTTVSIPVTLYFNLSPSSVSATATTLSIVYGYRPPRGADQTTTVVSPDTQDVGIGDFHEPNQFDREGSKVVNYYAVHAVNENSNAPIAGMPIKMTLINGIKELNDNKIQYGHGSFYNSMPITFKDSTVDYQANDYASERVQIGDNLVILPSKGKVDPSYLGNWKITDVAKEELKLDGSFDNLPTEFDLNYIIGNEKRLLSRNIVLAEVRAIDMEAITDEYGMAYFKVVFDPELALHTVTLAAYGVTPQNERVGISRVVSLRVEDSVVPKQTMTIENTGGIKTVIMPISMYFDTGAEYMFDMELVPSSFTIDPLSHCRIIDGDYNTGDNGAVKLSVSTDGNTSETGGTDTCEITWKGGAGSTYFEY